MNETSWGSGTVMSGETNLMLLLQSMQPILQVGEFVFCTLSTQTLKPINLQPIGQFYEAEGLTLILDREQADRANLPYAYVARMITLSVHSSLNAVGFLAAITTELARQDISVNPVSAYYHDHLFVPVDRAQEVMNVLQNLSQKCSNLVESNDQK